MLRRYDHDLGLPLDAIPVQIAPRGTALVEFQSDLDVASFWRSIDVEHGGARGDLVATALIQRGSDTATYMLSPSASRAYIGLRWVSPTTASTAIRVVNVGRKPSAYSISLFAADSSILYEVEGPVLRPGEDRLIDLAQLQHQGTPDKKGRRVPLTTEEGTFEVRASGGSGATLFAAAAAPASGDTGDVVPSYYEECCGHIDPLLDPSEFTGTVGATWTENVYVTDTCTGYPVGASGYTWSVDDPSVVGMGYGFTILDAGYATVTADNIEVWLGGPYMCGEVYYDSASAPVTGKPTLTIEGNLGYVYIGHDPVVQQFNLLLGQGNPAGGQYSWSSPDPSISFSSSSSARTNITATSYSGGVNDTEIDLNYSLNGVPADQAAVFVTKRLFKYLVLRAATTRPATSADCSGVSPCFGYIGTATYDVYTQPNSQLVTPGGLTGTAVVEEISLISFTINGVPTNPIGRITPGDGTLDDQSEVVDHPGLLNGSPLPDGIDETLDQILAVGNFFVRDNTLHLLSTNFTVTNNGPFN